MRLAALESVYAVTWAGVYGIAFPLLIMALVPLRQYALVKMFPASLRHLDTAGRTSRRCSRRRGAASSTAATRSPSRRASSAAGAFVQTMHPVPQAQR